MMNSPLEVGTLSVFDSEPEKRCKCIPNYVKYLVSFLLGSGSLLISILCSIAIHSILLANSDADRLCLCTGGDINYISNGFTIDTNANCTDPDEYISVKIIQPYANFNLFYSMSDQKRLELITIYEDSSYMECHIDSLKLGWIFPENMIYPSTCLVISLLLLLTSCYIYAVTREEGKFDNQGEYYDMEYDDRL